MAKQAEGGASTADNQEIARLKRERDTLKSQLTSTAVREVPKVLYQTTNPAEATTYANAGGTLVTITKLYPGTIRSGKRYGFAQSKEQLDALVKKQQEEGIV